MNSFYDKLFENRVTSEFSEPQGVSANMIKMVSIVGAAALLSEIMYSFDLGNQNMAMVYLLAVIIISSSSSFGYGICAAVLGTFAYDFQITTPRFAFSFTTGLPITLFIMLLVTVVVSTITARTREKARISVKREHHAQMLYEINQKLLSARNTETIISIAEEYLTSHLNRPVILYARDPLESGEGYYETSGARTERAKQLYAEEQLKSVHRLFRIGGNEEERPFNDSSYDVYNAPVASKGRVFGVIGIVCDGKPLSENDLIFVRMLISQLALAMELQRLSDEQADSVVETEKEKTRGTLLRSISHDLRTPLTSILGASSAILEQKNLDQETLARLAGDIKEDAQWLIRMVENILIITRISGHSVKLKKDPEAAEEVISEVVSIIRKRFPGYTFHIQIPDELLLVPMDTTLISQVLINLLENAAKNSEDGSLILVNLREMDGYAEFEVVDNGSGIPENILKTLFEDDCLNVGYEVDVSRGTGLGLSICKAIVHAHGGTIEGCNRSKRGSKFSFRLPLTEVTKDSER